MAFLGLLAAMLLLALAQAVPALAASSPFDGGPLAVDTATTIANDHTVYAMRFSATTGGTYPLDADTTYHVKLRLTPNADGSPARVDNRGFTWNGTSGASAQERDDWTAFDVTTDATAPSRRATGSTTSSVTRRRPARITCLCLVDRHRGEHPQRQRDHSRDGVQHGGCGSVGASGIDDSANAGRTGKVVDYALKTS